MEDKKLIEKIAKRDAESYPYFRVWDCLSDEDKVPFLEDAAPILAFIKEAGYVKLADDQDFGVLPEPPFYSDRPYSNNEREAFHTGVLTFRNAIIKQNWRKVVLP